ncbi:protein translocase subunit [Marasmius tenuissimus]|nr:protein translocase subunit [Marasmius tenuissimus]
MSDFFKNPLSSTSSPSDVNARKEAIMNSVRSELAQANAQQLMNNMNERCYKACITKPGGSLSSSEEASCFRFTVRDKRAHSIPLSHRRASRDVWIGSWRLSIS